MAGQHSAIVKGCLTLLAGYGAMAQSQNTGGANFGGQFVAFGRPGTPDIIGALPPRGQFIGIEVKVGKDKQRESQIEWQARIEKVGGIYLIVRDLAVFAEWLCDWDRKQMDGRRTKPGGR